MLIGKTHKIEADTVNVTLYEKIRRKNKEGKFYTDWKVMGYFATPEAALAEMVNQRIRDTELTDMKTIVKEIQNLHGIIFSLLPERLRSIKKVL